MIKPNTRPSFQSLKNTNKVIRFARAFLYTHLLLSSLWVLPTAASSLVPSLPPTEGILSAKVSIHPSGPIDPKHWAVHPNIPAISHSVRLEKSVRITMTDGIKLSTDFYFPVDAPGPYPVILIRTPYNKNSYRAPGSIAHYFASQAYVVAVQDVRGRFESEGGYTLSAADPADGSDVLSWLAQQRWSSGKIGTYGCSYSGENQMQLAAQRHPNHTAAIAQAAGGAYAETQRQFMYREGGVPELANNIGWFWSAAKVKAHLPASLSDREFAVMAEQFDFQPKTPALDITQAVHSLPIISAMKNNGLSIPTDYEAYVSSSPDSPFWSSLNYVDDQDRFNLPTLHINSWYDGSVNETLHLFNRFRLNSDSRQATDNQFVMISPATHCGSERLANPARVGERDMGNAAYDYLTLYLRWFNHWLKEAGSEDFKQPRVQYYVMGKNQWQTSPSWPLPDTELTRLYLHGNGTANTAMAAGRLDFSPSTRLQSDTFHYDPMNPQISDGNPKGPVDQSESLARTDGLVYTSDPLTEGLEVTGPLSAVLYVSSSAKDTDFTVKLLDVYPDGRAFNLQEAILRARYRNDYKKPTLMVPGEVYRLTINLHATANYFKAGHRIRLEVSSSNFPRYVRNLNTGGHNYDESKGVVAINTVHQGAGQASYLLLPIVNQSGRSLVP